MTAFSLEGAAIAARWAIAVSGLIIAFNHVWMWHRDRDRRADRYQKTLLAYAVSIGLVFSLPLICQQSGWHQWARLLEIAAGIASIAHAIASVKYSEWLHLVARWQSHGQTTRNPDQQG